MYGYVKVGSAVPKLRVADCVYNKEEILKLVEEYLPPDWCAHRCG